LIINLAFRGALEELAVQLLRNPGLAIEAEAIRRSAADIELLDKLLASLESRRDKALRRIAEYRGDLGRQMRNAADRIIEGQALALEDGSRARPPEAA
jgi:hypothetical protein